MKFQGYIYWPNKSAEAPEGYPGYIKPVTANIALFNDTFYLGDDQHNAPTFVERTFQIDLNAIRQHRQAKITLELKAVPRKDPIVRINGIEIGRAFAETQNWEQHEFAFDIKLLLAGENLIELETYIPNMWNSYDDCEVRNVILHLIP